MDERKVIGQQLEREGGIMQRQKLLKRLHRLELIRQNREIRQKQGKQYAEVSANRKVRRSA